MGISMELVPPIAAITVSTLLGRLSSICRNIATKALGRSSIDVGILGLARSRCSNSSQKCSMGLRSGLCAGQSSSSTPIMTTHFCMYLALCMGELSCWNRKGPSLNCCHKVWSTESSWMSLYAVALTFPFTLTKGRSSNHEKQPQTIIPPPPYFTVGTMHSGRWRFPCIRQTHICLSDFQMVKCDSSLQRTRFHRSRVQWRLAWHHSCLALHMVILGFCAATLPWKPISWRSRPNSYCADIASRGSLELCSEFCNQGQTIFTRYRLQHSLVLFCEFVWPTTSWFRGWS